MDNKYELAGSDGKKYCLEIVKMKKGLFKWKLFYREIGGNHSSEEKRFVRLKGLLKDMNSSLSYKRKYYPHGGYIKKDIIDVKYLGSGYFPLISSRANISEDERSLIRSTYENTRERTLGKFEADIPSFRQWQGE